MAKRKQPDLPEMKGPGVAPVRIAAIEKLADRYIAARDARMEMTPQEIAAKTNLIEALRENSDKIGVGNDGVITYRYDSLIITLAPGKAKLKVRDEVEEQTEEE